jgi:hypothetical protein
MSTLLSEAIKRRPTREYDDNNDDTDEILLCVCVWQKLFCEET